VRGCRVNAALDRRWQRFDVEYRLPTDLPASVKATDGKMVYTARASITIARSLSRVAPASWSTGVQCWSPEVRFAVEGTLYYYTPLSRGLAAYFGRLSKNFGLFSS